MFLTILFAAALASAFVSAAAAVIVAAAGANPVSYRISVLVGSGVGIAFGIASIYLVSFVGAVTFFIAFLLPAQFDAMASIFVLILLDIARAALAGTAVAAVAGRSSLTIRRGALIGAGFGLFIGIANRVANILLYSAGAPAIAAPAIAALGLDWPSAFKDGTVITVILIALDIALTFAAFRFVRSRRLPAKPTVSA